MNVRLYRAVLGVKVICRGEDQALRVGVHGPRPTLPAISKGSDQRPKSS